jgi:hypothetical protein
MNRLKSVLKWIGLYLLANLGGGFVGWGLGVTQNGAVFGAVIFVVMIVHAVLTRERKARA